MGKTVSRREAELLEELEQVRRDQECLAAVERLWDQISHPDGHHGRELDEDLSGTVGLTKADADLITDYICTLENKAA